MELLNQVIYTGKCIGRIKKFIELWSPARQQIWPWSRSKVKVTTWYHRKGLVTKDTHAKYQSSNCNSAKVMTKVKVFGTDGRMRFNVPALSRKRRTTRLYMKDARGFGPFPVRPTEVLALYRFGPQNYFLRYFKLKLIFEKYIYIRNSSGFTTRLHHAARLSYCNLWSISDGWKSAVIDQKYNLLPLEM